MQYAYGAYKSKLYTRLGKIIRSGTESLTGKWANAKQEESQSELCVTFMCVFGGGFCH